LQGNNSVQFLSLTIMSSPLSNKFAKYPSELIDFSLFLLLVFAEDYLRKIFPENIFDLKLEEMTTGSGYLLVIAGGLGMITFFRKPNNAEMELKGLSFSSGFSVMAGLFGGMLVSFMLCFMVLFGFIKLGSVYAPDEGTMPYYIMMVICVIMFIGVFVFPFFLISRYGNKYETLKLMHPSMRYLLLLPAIFLTASFLNSAEIFPTDSYRKSALESIFVPPLSFAICIIAPRLFATGERLEWKGWLFWLVRFGFYLFGLLFDFSNISAL